MALIPSREAVAVALYNLVSVASGNIPGLVTSSRRLVALADVDSTQMPALYVRQLPEHQERTQQGMMGLPPKRVMWFDIFVYTADPQDGSLLPITQLNNILDAVETALLPDAITGRQTLGGLVTSCRINGQILIGDSIPADPKSVGVIPIEVVRP
jgi:hypothetical protein